MIYYNTIRIYLLRLWKIIQLFVLETLFMFLLCYVMIGCIYNFYFYLFLHKYYYYIIKLKINDLYYSKNIMWLFLIVLNIDIIMDISRNNSGKVFVITFLKNVIIIHVTTKYTYAIFTYNNITFDFNENHW